MLDTLIKNGTVVDGTGSSRRLAAVGIKDGKLVLDVSVDQASSARTIDAEGLIFSISLRRYWF